MDFSFSSRGGGGGGARKPSGKAKLLAEARKARAQRAKTLGAQREADRQLEAARLLQRAARRCPCVRRLRLRKALGDELDADLVSPAAAGSLCGLCRRLLLFCDLRVPADVTRFRKLSLLVLKNLGDYCSSAVSDSRWFEHAARFGGIALQKLGSMEKDGDSNTEFATEIRLLVALTDSASWGVVTSDVTEAKSVSKRVLAALVLTYGLHAQLRGLLLRHSHLANEPLWSQAVLTLAARPVLVLEGSAKVDAVRHLVLSQFTIPGLLACVPRASIKPLLVVFPAVLQWLSVPKLQAEVSPMSKLTVVANCVYATLESNRQISSATLQRLVTVATDLLQATGTEVLATEQEAAQLAAAWHPRNIKMLVQATVDDGVVQELNLPWTVTCEVEQPTNTAAPMRATQQGICLFFSLLYEAIAQFPAMQNNLVSNLCAVSEPSVLAIVWGVLLRGNSDGNLISLLNAAAKRNLGSHSLLKPLQMFLRMGLLVYVVLRDDEILGSQEQVQAFPLTLPQLADAINLLNQIAFRCLWDGDGLPFSTVDRDICSRCIKLLSILYQIDERARIKGTQIMPESQWHIGNSKLSKMFETELIRRSGRAASIAAQMSHLPKRSAAQKLAAAERRRTVFSGRSDPARRAEALRLQGLEAVGRVDFGTAMQCLCAAIEIDSKNFLAFANRSAVHCSLGENTAALDDARKSITLAKDSPVGYMRLAVAQTELNDLPNAKANFDIAASLAPQDVRLESLARDADKRLQLQVEESKKRVQRLADAERKAQDRALAKKAAMVQIREDEKQRQERDKAAALNKKAAMERQKAQRREEHLQRQKAEKDRRDARRAEREEQRAHRSEIKAQEDAQRQRIEMATEKKRQAIELARQNAEVELARQEAEEARITSLKWKKTMKERQILNEEKIRMLAKQRRERRRMEREHASEKKIRSRQAAAILASSGTSVPSEYICPLSGNIMLDPVTASDGYQYARSSIQAWQAKNDTSPMTDQRMTKWLVPHSSLRHAIETWLANNADVSIQSTDPTSLKFEAQSEPQSEPQPEPEPEPELEVIDPISLEPLSELRYPPFNLPIDGEDGSHPELYDARVLSNYLVSSGNFCHPTSRRPLQRAECQRMDTFIRRHRLGRPCVTASFDHTQGAETTESRLGEPRSDLAEQHREEASDILLTLFGESPAEESLRVVDHALRAEQQAGAHTMLTGDDFPSLQ